MQALHSTPCTLRVKDRHVAFKSAYIHNTEKGDLVLCSYIATSEDLGVFIWFLSLGMYFCFANLLCDIHSSCHSAKQCACYRAKAEDQGKGRMVDPTLHFSMP